MKKNRYIPICLATSSFTLLVLANACNLTDRFPSKISDIDTLGVYKKYLDSIQHENPAPPPSVVQSDTVDSDPLKPQTDTVQRSESPINTGEQWTICLGTFKIKENAERKIKEIQQKSDIHLFTRNNLFYVTIGLTESRSASTLQKQAWALPQESYIMKITPSDQFLPVQLK